ncbi:hypothetical protein ABZ636_18505 [Streptomyces sp. NPDC007251]|uniref:hypothetical protein n=1 Tax=Streptomyces sp. NPDC007251 TaxID=3154483 RepID=UPI0033E658B5
MRRRTARALSAAFAAGAVLAVAGPAAAADIDPGAPPAAQTAVPEGAPGACTAPQQCASAGGPAAFPDAAAPSYDPALPSRGEGAPSLQGVTPTREGWTPGAAPSGGYGVTQPAQPAQPAQPPQAAQPPQVAPSSPGLAPSRDAYPPSQQGITPSHDGVAPTRDGFTPGHDGVGACRPGEQCADRSPCREPGRCDGDAEPPTVQHGVEAGTGGSFTDSVPALAAGATLIAAACGGAGYRLYGRWRAAVGRSAHV